MYYDIKIFNFINSFAHQSKSLDILGIFFAHYLSYLLGLLLFILIWPKKDRAKNRTMVLLATASGTTALILKTIISFFYQRPRPYVNMPLAHKLMSMATSENMQSFPSGHALFFFGVSTAIYLHNKKLGVFFLVCSTLIGVARIFVGVHWPSDIIAGAILGIMTGIIINWIYFNYFKKVATKT